MRVKWIWGDPPATSNTSIYAIGFSQGMYFCYVQAKRSTTLSTLAFRLGSRDIATDLRRLKTDLDWELISDGVYKLSLGHLAAWAYVLRLCDSGMSCNELTAFIQSDFKTRRRLTGFC